MLDIGPCAVDPKLRHCKLSLVEKAFGAGLGEEVVSGAVAHVTDDENVWWAFFALDHGGDSGLGRRGCAGCEVGTARLIVDHGARNSNGFEA